MGRMFGRRDALVASSEVVSLGVAFRGAGRCGLGHGSDLTQLCDRSTSLGRVSRCLPFKCVQALKLRRRGRERGGKRGRKNKRWRGALVQGRKIGREKKGRMGGGERIGNFWIMRWKEKRT